MGIENRDKIQKEIVDSLPNPCHGLLLLAPRVGKTKIGIDLIKREKPKKILWVTPSTKLRDIDIPLEFKTWRALSYLKRTDIICYASLAEHKGSYDVIYLDEYQDLTANNSAPLFSKKIKYKRIIGLSGTHPKHGEKQKLYDRLGLEILTSMTIDEAVSNKLIAEYNITVVRCKLDSVSKHVKAGSKTKSFLNTESKHYSYLSKIIAVKLSNGQIVPKFFYLNRMRFIYNLKSKNDKAKRFVKRLKGRTLVFTGSIEKAEHMCKHTYHSKTTDEDYNLFQDEKINTLACVNSGGVGNTYRNVDNFVVVQVNSNKKGDATQKIARSLVLQDNYKAKIFIFVVTETVDERWLEEVLQDFDTNKVEYINYEDYG